MIRFHLSREFSGSLYCFAWKNPKRKNTFFLQCADCLTLLNFPTVEIELRDYLGLSVENPRYQWIMIIISNDQNNIINDIRSIEIGIFLMVSYCNIDIPYLLKLK